MKYLLNKSYNVRNPFAPPVSAERAEDMVAAMAELQADCPVLDIELPKVGDGRLVLVGDVHGQLQETQ